MVDQTGSHGYAGSGGEGLKRVFLLPALAGALAIVLALSVSVPTAQLFGLAVGGALLGVALMLALRSVSTGIRRTRQIETVTKIAANDTHAAMITDASGEVAWQNPVALDRYGDCSGLSLMNALAGHFASPDAALMRMLGVAELDGFALEVVTLRRGQVRVTAQQVAADLFLWRFEQLAPERAATPRMRPSLLPQLVLSAQGGVVSQNEAARTLAGRRALAIDELIADLPLRPGQIHRLNTVDGSVGVLVLEPEQFEDRRELYLIHESDLPLDVPHQGLDTLPVPVLELSETGGLEAANAQALEILGLDSIHGRTLQGLVEGLGRPLEGWLSEATHAPLGHRAEVVRLAQAETDRYLRITLGSRPAGQTPRLVAVLQDATDLKTLEAQFVQSQKMEAIGQLAGGVAHDFNNLLTAISGHCDLLLMRHDPGDPDFPDLEQINQNANRAASLVSQLLAFSRKQTLRPEPVDLRDTLSDVSHLLNRLLGERVQLELRHDPNLRHVRADRRQLEQVFMNLAVNARDAMPEGGAIRIETRAVHLPGPLKRDRAEVPAGDYVVATVADEGVGIPADKLPKIFEPFFTTKRQGEGTGLGLSTVYGIVKQSGGFVFADSTPGDGTEFTLYFPAHVGPVPDKAAPAAKLRDPQADLPGEGVILLVEDEAPVRAFAARALRLRGFTVLEADSAEAALALLADLDTAVDVFVTDVIMPGLDGPSWVQEALEQRPRTRVIFMSGYAEENFAEAQAMIPGSIFLPKPFTLSQLTATVQSVLD